MEQNLEVIHNQADQQFEIHVGSRVAALVYSRSGSTISYLHTEVPVEAEGLGIGSRLVRYAIDYARANHLEVIPRCSFVAAYLRSHPQDLDVVAPVYRTRIQTGSTSDGL